MTDLYPKPKALGGQLIRDVVGFLKKRGLALPFNSPVNIAVSGGPDSMALAHLLIQYGRRIVPRSQITLLHVDHGWRGAKSRADAAFVSKYAQKMGVPIVVEDLGLSLKSPQAANSSYSGRSWEEVAREARKKFFHQMAQQNGGVVLTAHQGDDLAETLLWRLFTGAAATHGAGISFQAGREYRPFLPFRKNTLLSFLKEEKQRFRVDETNFEGRFLRSKIRKDITSRIEKIFPKAIDHLIELGLQVQSDTTPSENSGNSSEALQSLFAAAGLRGRRNHWEALAAGQSRMDLPGGWTLTRDVKSDAAGAHATSGPQFKEKWVLERKSGPKSDVGNPKK